IYTILVYLCVLFISIRLRFVTIHLCFIFFQAGDGIRDRNVTGVQTCALPILPSPSMNPQPSPAPILTSFQRAQVNGSVHEAGAPSGITGRLPTARTQRSRSRITDGIPPLFRCARTRQVTPQNLGIRPRDPLCSNSVKHSMQVSFMALTIAHVTTRRNIQHKNAPKQPPLNNLYIQAKTTQPA